jgi:hypothetical protein
VTRALVHPRLFSRLGMGFNRRVTFERYTKTGKSPTGAELWTWAVLRNHADLPAGISVLTSLQKAAYSTSTARVMLAGYHPDVSTKDRLVDDEGNRYEIDAVEHLHGQITRLMVSQTGVGAAS